MYTIYTSYVCMHYTYTYTYIHLCIQYTHVHGVYMYVYVYAIHTYIHAHVHTRSCLHMQMQMFSSVLKGPLPGRGSVRICLGPSQLCFPRYLQLFHREHVCVQESENEEAYAFFCTGHCQCVLGNASLYHVVSC